MKLGNGSPRLYLASSGRKPVVDVDARLRLVLMRLEDCQATLVETGERETAQLVAMATLQLRMRLQHIGDAELKALCDALEPKDRDDAAESGVSKASGERS